MERAKRQEDEQDKKKFTELKRENEEEKIRVNLNLSSTISKEVKPTASTAADVFKGKDSSSKWETSSSVKSFSSVSSRKPKTALEEIREEEERRKAKKMNRDHWLYDGIVVKVMTKKLGDKFYKEKGTILQVIDKYVAVVKMNNNGTKVKVDQEYLETVIPSVGKLITYSSSNAQSPF